MARLSNAPLPLELLCNGLVPVANLKVQKAILRLKEPLTFKYYIQFGVGGYSWKRSLLSL